MKSEQNHSLNRVVREHGTSARTYKSGLVFVVAQSAGPLAEDARRVLAWEEIQKELPGINVDTTQIVQLEDNIKKSRRDLRDSVWRSYNNIALLGKNNEIRFIDLGNMHSSAATSIIQFIVNELVHVDEIQSGISPNLLVRNWPPFGSGVRRPCATHSLRRPCSRVYSAVTL